MSKGGDAPAAPAPINPGVLTHAQISALPSIYSPQGKAVYSGDASNPGAFRQDITYSPEMQRQFDSKNRIAEALSGRVEQALPGISNSFEFDGATDPTSNRRFSAQQALLDPIFERDEERERQRLNNQGIPEGSEAFRESFDDFDRRKSAAYEQAASNALDTGYGEALSTRQQNLNEIAQVLGGQQLAPTGGAGSPVDVLGSYAQNQAGQNMAYQGQLAGYNADVASKNALGGAAAGLGSAAMIGLSF